MNTEIKNILVPTDFSEKSNNAVEMAVQMALRHHARIILFHIVNNYYILDRSGKQVIGSETVKENAERAESKLSLIKEYIQQKHSSLEIEVRIKNENLVDSINDFVVTEDIDLVVMGTSGKQKLKQLILGSSSYNVLSYVNCSILLVPGSFKKYHFKKILFPVRVTKHLDDKLELSITLAKKNKGIISLLGISDEDDLLDLKNAYLDLQKKLYIKSANYTSEFLLTQDKAVQISKFSKRVKADIIILNYQDEESWKSIFSENFLKKIINKTEIPLFFLKPKITRKITPDYLNSYDITLPCPG